MQNKFALDFEKKKRWLLLGGLASKGRKKELKAYAYLSGNKRGTLRQACSGIGRGSNSGNFTISLSRKHSQALSLKIFFFTNVKEWKES